MKPRGALLLAFLAFAAAGMDTRSAGFQGRSQPPQAPRATASGRIEVLRSIGGLPPEIVGLFDQPIAFQQARSGQYFVLDRRGHTVYGIDAAGTTSWKIVQIGQETGRIIEPSAFDLEPTQSTFIIADAPGGRERLQVFGSGGRLLGGFTLPGKAAMRVTIEGLTLSGVGSLRYTGHSVLVSQPEIGALVTEYTLSGSILRTFGTLRPTGQEADRDVHLALNAGLPLVNPRGGYYFVFQTGIPLYRKYDRAGTLVFERHIEGLELDPVVMSLPTRWPRRKSDEGRELPLVPPVIRTAAVDHEGNLWVSLTLPYTYVYTPNGEKARTVQFRGAGILAPGSLFFTHTGTVLVAPGCYEFKTVAGG